MAFFTADKKNAILIALLLIYLLGQELVRAQETTTADIDNLNFTTTTPYSTLPWCYDLRAPGRESDCPNYKYLCNDEVYYNFMTWQCPETCDRCWAIAIVSPRTGIFANGTCVDLTGPNGRSDCTTYASLCQHSHYGPLMATECPRTCGYCPKNSRG